MYPQTYKQGDFQFSSSFIIVTQVPSTPIFPSLGGLWPFSLNVCLFQRSVAESAKSGNEPQNDIAALGRACAQSWADFADAQFLPDQFSNHYKVARLLELPFKQH